MSHTNPIFISPHRDDVCFSLAATIAIAGGGKLINIFSRSQYTSQPSLADLSPGLDADMVSAIRNREDEEFAACMNLERHELGLEDADLRGLPWNVDASNEDDQETAAQARHVSSLLAPLLQALTATHPASLYCPMAIGGHRDHLATLLATQELRSTEWGNQQDWIFYEDLPYASWPGVREASLPRFKAITHPSNLQPRLLQLRPEPMAQKLNLVRIYASQHPHNPSIKEFICTDPWIAGPHEALWTTADRREA